MTITKSINVLENNFNSTDKLESYSQWLFPEFGFIQSQHTKTDHDSNLRNQWGFIPGLKEFLMLRQVHALEHATVWVLSNLENHKNKDNPSIGGLATEQGFFLYGKINILLLNKAVRIALKRLQKGEWDLALHPRCGTNTAVTAAMMTTAMMAAHVVLPKDFVSQILGVGLTGLACNHLAPEIGMSVQKYLTTSIPFNLKIQEISRAIDQQGRSAHFISLKWQNSQ